MFYSAFYALISLSAVVSMVLTIQVNAVNAAVYAISPTIYELGLYVNDAQEWTFSREQVTQSIRLQLDANLTTVFEDVEWSVAFYHAATLVMCDEVAIACTGVAVTVKVDYSLFIQERTYRYELQAE